MLKVTLGKSLNKVLILQKNVFDQSQGIKKAHFFPSLGYQHYDGHVLFDKTVS